MTFGQAIATCFRKYVDFSGYASRSEYWWWTLFTALVGVATAIVDAVQNTGALNTIWQLAVLLPSLAVLVRRLRDAGHHWAWVFIGLVPLVGGIVLLVFTCQASRLRRTPPAPAYSPYSSAR